MRAVMRAAMRADMALADRHAAVRGAARSWKRAGVVDDEALAAIEKAWPDDRVRVGPVFRVLLFLFTLLAINAGAGLFWLLFLDSLGNEATVAGVSSLLFGCLLVALTEFQIGRLRRSQGGTEAATSLAALGYLSAGFAWILFELLHLPEQAAVRLLLVVAALLLAAAAWRWGYPLFAGAAAAALLAAIAAPPWGRVLWIALPLAVLPLLRRLTDSARLPPAHRASWKAVLLVGLAALYVAVHLGSFDDGLVEEIGDLDRSPGPAARSLVLRWLSIAATALVPAGLFAIAIRTRRSPFLLAGLATVLISVATLLYYEDLGPVWAELTVAGIALAAAALALRRYLDSGPNRERRGFTAEPLFEDLARQRLLEIGATVASLSPEARAVRDEPRFNGGGGEFGGGGSSSGF